MVLSFAPGWWSLREMSLLNDFRMAMDELLASPEQEAADFASNTFEDLMQAVEQQKRWGGTKDANTFLPDADYSIAREQQVEARLVVPSRGNLELYEVGQSHACARQHERRAEFACEQDGAQETFRASPSWLASLSSLGRSDLEGDLQILRTKFGLASATLERRAVNISGALPAVEAARKELVEGILQYYGTQVEWSAAELPAEPEEEPPTRAIPKRPLPEEPQPEMEAWGDAPEAGEVSWDQGQPGEQLPGLREALRRIDLEHLAATIEHWAIENGAVSVNEVAENLEMMIDELGLGAADAQRLQQL
ncbi:unnamed protein product [Effrenium voratum]|nr:unnamed protein product [Effrenium voratum]